MQGVGAPTLLLPPGASPHAYAMKPSGAQALADADAVFWIGEALEGFLKGPIAALARHAEVVELIDTPGVIRLPTRKGGPWDREAAGHGQSPHGQSPDDQSPDDHGAIDPHIWLDPENAVAIADAMATTMAKIDPENAARYRANSAAFTREINALIAETETILASARDTPTIVFHDAYQYFENRYGLNVVGAIALNPETRPSARRMQGIRARLAETNAACVFIEPEFPAKRAEAIVAGTAARIAALDPLGAGLTPGASLYPSLIKGLAAAYRACVARR